MVIELLYLFLAAVVTFLFYPLWISFVYKFQMGEEIRPDGPQTHVQKKGTPTMGGVVFFVTVALITFLFNSSRTQTLLPIFVATMAGLFGLMEDFSKVYKKSGLPGFFRYHVLDPLKKFKIVNFVKKPWDFFKEFWRVLGSGSDKGLDTHHKIIIQFLIAGFVSFWTYIKLGWDYLWLPLIGDVHIGILYPIFIFFLFLTFLNFVAFTDGLDGLAGGLSLTAFIAFWVISSALNYNALATLCATFVGAMIPFMYFNIFPARIFMGNVGSHVLGAIFPLIAVLMHREIALLFICAVFFFDGLSSPLQQLSFKLTKKRIFRMAPLHHHFEMLGWPETKVTLRFWLAGISFAFIGIFISLL